MYIPGVTLPRFEPIEVRNDIREEEARKIIASFASKTSTTYVRIYNNNIDIIQDSAILFRTNLKINITEDMYLPDIFIDMTYQDSVEDCLLNCLWVKQYYMSTVPNIVKGELLAKEENLRENPKFEQLVELKADDPMKFFKLAGFDKNTTYKIPMFCGLLKLSKPDTVDVEVYYNDTNSVLVDFYIYKKKFNRVVEMMYKILLI